MTIPLLVKRSLAAILLIIAIVLQGTTSVLAGTTGAISGTVTDASSQKPIPGARVTVTSPSGTASATADPSGRFAFLSLAPDTYNVSVAATGTYDAYSLSGVTVQADQTLNVQLTPPLRLTRIGSVTSRSSSALVKPGTTADVYSINAATQDKASQLGGGGTLNSAYSAISSVPGVFVAPNQVGYIGAGPTLSIRGGDYDQIGYELDGIPVNRSFDNYPSGQLSSLGQQEVQVYTGATPANAEAEGISGYINQVIRTGSAPAYRSLDLAAGAPAYYNRIAFETGGANPSRTFSYYVGLGAYNQDYRFFDQFNGASLDRYYGSPLAPCNSATISQAVAPSCYGPQGQDYTNGGATPAYVLGPVQAFGQAETQSRDTVANFHFGIPRKDGSRDDVQFLYDNNHLSNYGYDSTNDQGGTAFLNAIGLGTPFYLDGFQTTLPYGTLLGQNYTGGSVKQFNFPNSSVGRPLDDPIPANARDEFVNDQAVVKLQYQHNFGSSAFFRIYGYTSYTDWMNNGPQTAYSDYLGFDPVDYQLASHARGLSFQFSDQVNSKNLVSFQGSYVTANSFRFNDSGYGHGNGTVGYLVDSSNPANGICYSNGGATAAPGCLYATNPATGAAIPFQTFTLQQALTNTVTPATGTCGGGPCEYLVVGGGAAGSYNTVVPRFSALSLTDDFRPTDKLAINLGLRYDLFQFLGSDTTNGGLARELYYNAWNLTHPGLQEFNVPSQEFAYPEFQPRLGFTYTLDPTSVVRASYGRYAQAPNAAFEQYNYLQPNAPASLANFVKFGIGDTPGHEIRPEVSNNYDVSLEHQFGRDVSIKLTPFLRKTQDQIQNFFLDQKTSFVSGLNVGRQTSQGLEFEADKGDFSRDGIAARLSFTYTNSYVQYDREPNGTSIVDPINAAISNFNAFTRSGGGSPCYTTGGAAAPACGAGTVANPYYNQAPGGLLGTNDKFPTFDQFPGAIGTVADTFGAPYVLTLLAQYKKGPLSVTPSLQFNGGVRFGTPENTPGINPAACTGVLPGSVAGDPRYPVGAPGGQPYDYTTCGTSFADGTPVVIPDPATGHFDGLGEFVAPNFLQANLQVSYTVNKRLTFVSTLSNLYTRCYGGHLPAGLTVAGACGYGLTFGAGAGPQPIGNQYNPGYAIQPFLNRAYDPTFNTIPFNAYFEARIKI